MWIRVCRYKNAGVAGYAEAFIPVQSDSQTSEWYSYFENAVLDHPRSLLIHERSRSATIYGLLPEDQGQWLKALWEEFEAYETPEAKFAHVLDNCQPLFLNDASNGKSWEEHQVKKSQIYKRNRKTGEGSEVIWEYMKELVDKHIALGHVIDDEKDGR